MWSLVECQASFWSIFRQLLVVYAACLRDAGSRKLVLQQMVIQEQADQDFGDMLCSNVPTTRGGIAPGYWGKACSASSLHQLSFYLNTCQADLCGICI